jgi:ATP-binding cassette, subfamily B (MDR/TAP), member 1
VTGKIEFVNVRFRYSNRPETRILRQFSLRCHPNETVALVGPSGSGKSTVIALLQRFYDHWSGKILLDGHDIRILNLSWLRSLMGLVQQEPALFNLSIRDNIAYGHHSQPVTDEQIEHAARMADVHDLICQLPQVLRWTDVYIRDLLIGFRVTTRCAAVVEVSYRVVKSNAVSERVDRRRVAS